MEQNVIVETLNIVSNIAMVRTMMKQLPAVMRLANEQIPAIIGTSVSVSQT
jgi:hypothetical protein